MEISPFTPLFFVNRRADGIDSEYIQTFSTSDEILIEVICAQNETPVGQIFSEPGHTLKGSIQFSRNNPKPGVSLCYSYLSLEEGCYSVGFGERISEPFLITNDDAVLKKTILLQYSPADNKSRRDVMAFAGETRLFFTLRLPGGFKDSGLSFSVDNEQFVTDSADIIELYSLESMQKKLTIGTSSGVPIWIAQMINRILTCKYLYIDGQRHARYESSVPEIEQVLEGINSFVITQMLQEVRYIEPKISDVT